MAPSAQSSRRWLRSLFLGLAQASAQHFYEYAELPASKRHQETDLLKQPAPPRRTKETSKNPFAHAEFYVNPINALEYNKSIETAHGKVKHNLQKMQHVPSAYWIDRKAKIRGNDMETLEGILKDASKKKVPQLCVFIWYNLPNRDCHAKASNGEICCHKDASGACSYGKASDCADGLEEYRTEYADPFIKVLKEYQDKVPMVIVVEPDSLPNLATNLDMPRCGSKATQQAYKEGVKYAIDQLTTHVPKAGVYIDAAHGGWLGWEDNIEKFMNLLKKMDLPLKGVRGFSTNVANYQPLGVKCPYCPDQDQGFRNGFCLNGKNPDHPCCTDACDLLGQYNPSNNEMNYALHLVTAADSLLNMNAHVVIDTGRSGVDDMRSMCSSWCNPRGAGAGIPSTSKTAHPSIVDAYFWLKTPGESDGCTEKLPDGSSCPRFDSDCEGEDSIGGAPHEPRAPEAGAWFDYQVKQLAENAHLEHPRGTHESKAETCEDSISTSKPKPKYDSDFDGSAAEEFAQCGGEGWTGPTTCPAGCRCTEVNQYWWQCDPPGGEGLCRDEWPDDDAPKADSEPISWVVWALSSAGAILGLSSAVVIGYLLCQRQPLVVDPNGQPLQQSRV